MICQKKHQFDKLSQCPSVAVKELLRPQFDILGEKSNCGDRAIMRDRDSKLRRRVAWEAARLMYFREETEYYRAKLKAARRVYGPDVRPGDLPSNREIRE